MGSSASSERRNRHQQQQQQQPPPQQQQPPTVPQQQRGPQNTSASAQQYPAANRVAPPGQAAMYPAQQQYRPPQQVVPPPSVGGVCEAESIKNEATVMVESIKYDPAACLLRFTTNANIAFDVEVHVAVRVDVMHGQVMITPNKPKAPPPRVPSAAGEQHHEVPIDLTNVSEQEQTYLAQYPKQFPVVIVLYYTSPSDASNRCEEHTMVALRPEGKFVKQLLRTSAGVFKIENLFGGEHADVGQVVDSSTSPTSHGSALDSAPEAAIVTAQDEDEEGLCVICLTNQKNTVVMPCRHLCLCKECADELRQRAPKCPVCRGPLNQLVSVKS